MSEVVHTMGLEKTQDIEATKTVENPVPAAVNDAERPVQGELAVIVYSEHSTAAEARKALYGLAHKHLIEVEDALVVTKDQANQVHLHPVISLATANFAKGTARVALLSGLAGLWFGGLVGGAIGLGIGAVAAPFVSDAYDDYGVNNTFATEVGQSLLPGGSALAILFHNANPDAVIPELAHFGGAVYRTQLPSAFMERLQTTLSGSEDQPIETN